MQWAARGSTRVHSGSELCKLPVALLQNTAALPAPQSSRWQEGTRALGSHDRLLPITHCSSYSMGVGPGAGHSVCAQGKIPAHKRVFTELLSMSTEECWPGWKDPTLVPVAE